MVLVSYLYGIDSDRRLCEEVHFNLAYRWFCRLSLDDEVPDHSSFSRIRDRYGEEIYLAVFREIVKLCQQHGLVGESCSVMTEHLEVRHSVQVHQTGIGDLDGVEVQRDQPIQSIKLNETDRDVRINDCGGFNLR